MQKNTSSANAKHLTFFTLINEKLYLKKGATVMICFQPVNILPIFQRWHLHKFHEMYSVESYAL
jgi:hypothetical protein